MLSRLVLLGLFVAAALQAYPFTLARQPQPPRLDGWAQAEEWHFAPWLIPSHRSGEPYQRPAGNRLRASYDETHLHLQFEVTRPAGFETPRVVSAGETLEFAEDLLHFRFRQGERHEELTVNLAGITRHTPGLAGSRYAGQATRLGWCGELSLPLTCARQPLGFDWIIDQGTPSPARYQLAPRDDQLITLTAAADSGTVVSFLGLQQNQLFFQFIQTGPHAVPVSAEIDGVTLTGELPPGKTLSRQFKLERTPGQYAVPARFLAGDRVLAALDLLFNCQLPFNLTVTPYFLSRNQIEAEFECPPLPGGSIRAWLEAPGGEQLAAAELTLTADNPEKPVLRLSAERFAVGSHAVVRAELLSASGERQAAIRAEIVRSEPPVWHGTRAGLGAGVPPPWTPLRWEAPDLHVWGRQITLGPSGLPGQIVAATAPLLAAPAELRLEIDGQSVTPPLPALAGDSEKVVGTASMELPGCQLRWTIQAEFDGFIWYELEILPKRTITVNRLQLQFPLAAGQMTLFNTDRVGSLHRQRRSFTDPLPVHGALTEAVALPFSAFVWFGNEQRGLQYCMESNQFFSLQAGESPMRLEPSRFQVTMVSRPLTHDAPLRYAFGLQASPVKPLPRRDAFWSTNTFSLRVYGNNDNENRPDESLEDFRARVLAPLQAPSSGSRLTFHSYAKYACELISVYGWSPLFGALYTEDERFNAKYAAFNAAFRAASPRTRLTSYGGWGVNQNYSFFHTYGPEMSRRPFEKSGWDTVLHCANSPYADFLAYSTWFALTKYGQDGVYLDSTGNVPCCDRIGHGCGYIAPDGVRHGTYPIRATREAFKRIYKLTHGETVPDGVIYLHSGGIMLPVQAFADVILCGEPLVAVTPDLLSIDLPKYRSLYLETPYGIPFLICWHYFSDNLKIRTNEIAGFALVHGTALKSYPIHLLDYHTGSQKPSYAPASHSGRQVYLTMRAFAGDGDTAFYPYWNNGEWLTLSDPNVLGSFYVNQNGGVLLALCNRATTPVELDVRFRPPAGARSGAVADALPTGWQAASADAFALTIGPQEYRMLLVGPP